MGQHIDDYIAGIGHARPPEKRPYNVISALNIIKLEALHQ